MDFWRRRRGTRGDGVSGELEASYRSWRGVGGPLGRPTLMDGEHGWTAGWLESMGGRLES